MSSIIIVHWTCWQPDPHQRQWIWLQRVSYVTRNNAVKTIQNLLKLVHTLPLAQKVNFWNKPINFIRRMGMVTCPPSIHLQELRSFVSILHSTGHSVCTESPVQAKNIQVKSCSGANITSKGVMAGINRSPSAGSRTRAGICRCIENSSRTTRYQSRQLANFFELKSSTLASN